MAMGADLPRAWSHPAAGNEVRMRILRCVIREIVARIAEARIMIEQARLLTLNAAHRMDTVGNKVAKTEIAMIKVAVPNMAAQVIDWSIQAHGGGGTNNDFGLAHAYAMSRVLRLADGPDEVHRNQIGKLELRKYQQ